jgi:hypothetical protein
MKLLLPIIILCVLAGCRWGPAREIDLLRDAAEAEVIVLADVKTDGDRERLVARTVLKGKLSSEFRFKLGDEITPGYGAPLSIGAEAVQIDSILLFYKPTMGVMSLSGFWSVKNGRILALKGPDGDLSEFTSRIKHVETPDSCAKP